MCVTWNENQLLKLCVSPTIGARSINMWQYNLYNWTIINHSFSTFHIYDSVYKNIKYSCRQSLLFLYIFPVVTFMQYYGLFSRDLHILVLWWRSPLCSLRFCGDYPCVHYFYVPWLIMTSQWVIAFSPVNSLKLYT